jgi:hypothetical protein
MVHDKNAVCFVKSTGKYDGIASSRGARCRTDARGTWP